MKEIALILASLAAVASLPAQALVAAPAAPSYSVTVDFPYVGKYCFRGVKYAKGSFQPSVKLTSGDFYVGIWGNVPVDRGYELEVDYYAGYGLKLSKSWALDVGLTAYSYPGLDTSGGADKTTFEGYAGVIGTFGSFTTGLYVYNDFTLKAFTLQGTVGYSVTINAKASFNLLGTIGHVSPDGGADYTYYGVGATVPYKITDKLTFTAGLQFATHNIGLVEANHFWGTAGLTYAF